LSESETLKVSTMRSHGLAPEKPAPLSVETRRELSQCVRLLTGPDEERRRAFAAHVREAVFPSSRSLIIDRLVKVLSAGSETAQAQAAASLTDLGPAALLGLEVHLLRTRSPGLQARLAGAIASIARRQPVSSDFDSMITLGAALHRARDPAAREALGKALAEVLVAGRPLSGRGGRAGPDHPTDRAAAGQSSSLAPQPQEVGDGPYSGLGFKKDT
jgi:hypothetical protein